MATTDAAAGGPSVSSIFTRQSSGLIRTAGPFDVAIFNLGLISIGAAIALNHYMGPAFYPGADVFWATVFTTIGSAIFVAGFWFWSVTFPRAGGNYVFLSRSVPPWIAYSLSFLETGVTLIFGGLTALFFVQTAISPFFGMLAVATGNAVWADMGAWMVTQNGTFIVGSIALVVAALLPAWGMGRYFAFQKLLFVIAIVGLVVGAVALLLNSADDFAAQLAQTTGLSQSAVIAAAEESGWIRTDAINWGETVRFMVWPVAWIIAGLYSTGFGSEIRRISRSQLVGMVGAVLFAGAVISLFALLVNATMGHNFLGALVWNFESGIEGASTTVPPFVPLLIGLGTGSILVGVLVGLSFCAWFLFLIPAQLIYGQRMMVAWSFDRLMPDWMGYVSPRFRSPVIAIAISLVAGIAALAFLVYSDLGNLVFVTGIVFVWCCVLAVGVVFPYMRPEFFNQSPAAAYRVGGVPLMSVVCAAGLVFGIFTLALYLSDELAAGSDVNALLPNITLLVLGALVYWTARAIQRRRGVDVDLAFKQLPIE